MEKLYTIKGYNIYNKERYIQLGDAGRPVIQTRTGYRASRVILFENKERAYEFLVNFMNDRKRTDISWNVETYRASSSYDTLVGMINDERGYGVKRPGEVRVTWKGDIITNFYRNRSTKLNGNTVYFYSRTNM